MIDVFVAAVFAGCIYGIARAWGRRPNYCRVAGWTASAMFAVAAYTEYSIASAGLMVPSLSRLVPIMLFAVIMFRLGRRSDRGIAVLSSGDQRDTVWAMHVQALLNRLDPEPDGEGVESGEVRAAAEGA